MSLSKVATTMLLATLAWGAPVSAQGPAAPRPTMIFFAWDKPEIDRDAAATLDELIAAVGKDGSAKLRIVGHSDRSGPAASNRRSSLKRAESVRAYLVARGVAASAMSIAGLGEEQPIIATEDGVREPQNRRVEIHVAPGAAVSVAIGGGDGAPLGSVTIAEGPDGVTLTISASAMPPGVHGIHLHEKGLCEGPKFATAGGHWNPAGRQHGRDNPAGAHVGDLANLDVAADGSASASVRVDGAMIADGATIADADGTALVIHARADDYRTDPSGDSGDRIACAVIAPPK